jgi:ATP:cob(I)alamin adenosyltransferase
MSADSVSNGDKPPAPRREMRIYTGIGDAGETMLLGRKKVPKDSPRVQVYGTLDEATSALGLARASTQNDDICRTILELQGELIDVMTELATPPGVIQPVRPVTITQVERLERLIDAFEEERIATGHFVRPGGSLASAALDLARTITRRAERRLVTLSHSESVSPVMLKYFNRLSDLLYVLARIDEQRAIKKMVVQAITTTQVLTERKGDVEVELTLETSNRLIQAGMRKAQEIGVPMVLAVVDAGGYTIALNRMDGALLVSVALAPNKAYTAVTVRIPTHQLAGLSQPGEQLYNITANLPNLTIVGGGFPLIQSGVVVGGVGASGGSVADDMAVAQAMVDALVTVPA